MHEKVWDEVEYYSDGKKIAGFLYRPKDWKPGDAARPGIVVLHGYSGMKDVYGMDVPQWLWEAGYFVLSLVPIAIAYHLKMINHSLNTGE